jgi:hypothetical protein
MHAPSYGLAVVPARTGDVHEFGIRIKNDVSYNRCGALDPVQFRG